MSDTTDTAPTSTTTPAAPAPSPGADAITAALKSLQADNSALADEVKSRDARLAEQERELVTLRAQIDVAGKREREAAIVAGLRGAMPHASDFEIRSALAGLAEDGKVDRYSTDAEATVKAALEALKTSAPSLARGPVRGSGPNSAPLQPSPKGTSLRDLFGMRGR